MHDDTFARRVTLAQGNKIARRHFYTGRQFCTETFLHGLNSKKIIIVLLFFFTFSFTSNPDPRSVTFFTFCFFINLSVIFILFYFFSTLVQKWPSVQSCNSCKIDPCCNIVFVQFCLRPKVSSCNMVFVHFSALVRFWPASTLFGIIIFRL